MTPEPASTACGLRVSPENAPSSGCPRGLVAALDVPGNAAPVTDIDAVRHCPGADLGTAALPAASGTMAVTPGANLASVIRHLADVLCHLLAVGLAQVDLERHAVDAKGHRLGTLLAVQVANRNYLHGHGFLLHSCGAAY